MDTAIYVITTLCLIYMTALVVSFAYKLLKQNRAGRLKYIKGFKKGKFSLIYFASVPLYYVGLRHAGYGVGGALLRAIKSSVETVVLKFGYDNVSALMDTNAYFKGVMGLSFALICANAVIFLFAFVAERLYNYVKKQYIDRFSAETYVIVGYGKNTKAIIESIKGKRRVVLVADDVNDDVKDFAFIEKVVVVELNKAKGIVGTLGRTLQNLDKKVVNVIVDSGSDAENLKITEELSQAILELDYEKYAIDVKCGLYVYVFGAPENASAFYHYEKKTNGCVRYVNKYKLLAMDFVGNHPLTEYMTEKEIDYSTGTLRDEVTVNVVMVGFGKTAQQIFLTSVANNQFVTFNGREICDKPVNYWIYDKISAEKDKNLNHDFFRYVNAYDGLVKNKADYLPIPAPPANQKFFKIDVNDGDFYGSVRDNLSVGGKNAYNYLIVAYGTDMENLDMTEKFSEKLREWDLYENTKVFVKIRDDVLSRSVIDKEYARENGYVTFGAEGRVVYNIANIVSEANETMARYRHMSYAFEYMEEGEREADVMARARKEWFTEWQQVQRESNTYACLSIRSKLNLLGFDMSKDECAEDVSDEFFQKYSEGDPVKYTGATVNGKKVVDYGDCNFVFGSVRNIFGVHEHARWNAYEISCGYLPATIEEIKTKSKQELIATRKHRNITTFEGLYEYRRIMAGLTGKTEAQTDVIKYDYQLMDDLVWLLKSNGYKIVRKR